MRPIGKPMMKKEEAQAMLDGISNMGSMFMRGLRASAKAVGDYGRNVAGGAKIVGGAVKKVFTFPDEGKIEREKDRKNRAKAPVGAVGGTNTGAYTGE